MMAREEALELLRTHLKNENLIKHSIAVEAAMRAYAREFGEDEDKWGITGLLHDIDYEECPELERHSLRAAEILAEAGLPEDVVYAVKAHNEGHGLPREDKLSKALYAVDELTGLIVATALVRPSKKLADVKVKSVTKKMKDKSFAAAVDRDSIVEGAEAMGLDLYNHIYTVLEAMKLAALDMGL